MIFLKITDQVYSGFSVPIFQTDISGTEGVEGMNDEISRYLLNERSKAKAEGRFDWATPHDLHKQGNPSIDSVVDMFGKAISHLTRLRFDMEIPSSDISISADVWGSVTSSGAVVSMLNFAPLHWRGIYFVKCDTKVTIELAPPYPPAPIHGTGKYAKAQTKITLEPKTSGVVVFPANLTHSIVYAPGGGENIAIEVIAGVLLTEKEEST